MDEHATALYDAVVAAVPGWIERCVERTVRGAGVDYGATLASSARAAGQQAQSMVSVELQALLEADIDEQATTPLEILRAAVGNATAALSAAGIAPVVRDEAKRRLFPNDDYDLAPASLADVDQSLTQVGLMWGAYKAHVHLQRHAAR